MSQNIDLYEYEKDKRLSCKYGLNCYQKNKAHHEKFKHPPMKNVTESDVSESKKEKIEDSNSPSSSFMNNESKQNYQQLSKEIQQPKKKPKNVLTNWLKLPPNKKQKVTDHNDKHINNQEFDKNDKEKADHKIESPLNVKSPFTSDKIREKHSKDVLSIVKNNEECKNKITKNESEKDNVNDCKPPLSKQDSEREESTRRDPLVALVTPPLSFNNKEIIKMFFLVDMPDDFYKFWDFCGSVLSSGKELDAFKSVGLKLCGPYDVLAGKFSDASYSKSALLRHCRYYFDPPEFQTVIRTDETCGKNNKTEYHLGYFRDEPSSSPVFVAKNDSAYNCMIKPVAENIFGAVNSYLNEYGSTAVPFMKMKIKKLQSSLAAWAKKEDITLMTSTPEMKQRGLKVVTQTFHKAGLVVPYNEKTQVGYRELAENNRTIEKILTAIANSKTDEERKEVFSKLHPIVNWANIANDESDFGTSLELGLDLFSFGCSHLHEITKRLMMTAYNLLRRNEFATIIEAHLENRGKGNDVSVSIFKKISR